MHAPLLALGLTLLAVGLVPLTSGRSARAAGFVALGVAAWGGGAAWSLGAIVLGAALAALVVGASGLMARRLAVPRGASHNT